MYVCAYICVQPGHDCGMHNCSMYYGGGELLVYKCIDTHTSFCLLRDNKPLSSLWILFNSANPSWYLVSSFLDMVSWRGTILCIFTGIKAFFSKVERGVFNSKDEALPSTVTCS